MYPFKKLMHVDFTKKWGQIIVKLLPYYLIIIFAEIIINVFGVLTPLWWADSFSKSQFSLFAAVFALWLFMAMLDYGVRRFYTCLQVLIINSVQHSIYERLLSIDPINHNYKSGGALFSKIERGVQSYRDLLDSITFGILPTFIRTITVLISLIYYATPIASGIAFMLVSVIVSNGLLHWFILRPREKKLIIVQDTFKERAVDSINHLETIRSNGAANQTNSILHNLTQNLMGEETRFWNIHAALYTIIYLLYLCTVFVLGYYLFQLVDKAFITPLLAVALLGSYIRGTNGILKLERPIRTIIKAITGLQDFFYYVQALGAQTYPVLSSSKFQPNSCDRKNNNLEIENLVFNYRSIYSSKSPEILFNGHALNINSNNLYGIYGPSGIGKSTFAAILGGQIKPLAGSVRINGQDIYELDENARKALVIFQSQSNSLLHSTIKHNLILGIPDTAYTDKDLISKLQFFGINQFISGSDLQVTIGEKGLTLSGGQIQKIKFINTYLKIKYYNPAVVILDEPASHLDDSSALLIKNKIQELAAKSIVFVVSHKQSLFEHAYAISDFTLLKNSKQIIFINNYIIGHPKENNHYSFSK